MSNSHRGIFFPSDLKLAFYYLWNYWQFLEYFSLFLSRLKMRIPYLLTKFRMILGGGGEGRVILLNGGHSS